MIKNKTCINAWDKLHLADFFRQELVNSQIMENNEVINRKIGCLSNGDFTVRKHTSAKKFHYYLLNTNAIYSVPVG